MHLHLLTVILHATVSRDLREPHLLNPAGFLIPALIRRLTFRLPELRTSVVMAVGLFAIVFAACGSSDEPFDPAEFDPLTTVPAELQVRSPHFEAGEAVPVRFTCDGADEPPLVSWDRPPDGTRAVAMIMDDPDAPGGIFAHWIAFNLDPDDNSTGSLIDGDAAESAIEGANDFGATGYGGPCPPSGETHEYRFSVFALISPLALDATATAPDVLAAMRGTVIGHGVLSAEYARQ